MTDTTDLIKAARALIEPLTGYTPGPWRELDESECYSHDDGNTVSVAIGKRDNHAFALAMHHYSDRIVDDNAALIAAAPDLRDMIATLADALEAERAKVAAAYEAAALVMDDHGDGAVTGALGTQICCSGHHCGCRGASVGDYLQYLIRALTPADAQAALDKMLDNARLVGWRAGRDAATEPLTALAAVLRKSENSYHQAQASAMLERVDAIRALPEPKEASHD